VRGLLPRGRVRARSPGPAWGGAAGGEEHDPELYKEEFAERVDRHAWPTEYGGQGAQPASDMAIFYEGDGGYARGPRKGRYTVGGIRRQVDHSATGTTWQNGRSSCRVSPAGGLTWLWGLTRAGAPAAENAAALQTRGRWTRGRYYSSGQETKFTSGAGPTWSTWHVRRGGTRPERGRSYHGIQPDTDRTLHRPRASCFQPLYNAGRLGVKRGRSSDTWRVSKGPTDGADQRGAGRHVITTLGLSVPAGAGGPVGRTAAHRRRPLGLHGRMRAGRPGNRGGAKRQGSLCEPG